MPPIVEEPHVFETFPGGCFLVNGQWVDANGEKTKSPAERKAEADAQAEAKAKAEAEAAKKNPQGQGK